MEREPDAKTIDAPSGSPPDEGLTYDPEMTDQDEANIPAESKSDPEADPPSDDEALSGGARD